MAPEKETIMVLKVDLQCPRCFKKVKRVLCKFPQIRDQVYDEKQNIVIIKVLCCSPEKIRDKICIKGGKSIHSIEIKEPPKPKPTPPAKPTPPPPKPDQCPPKPPEKPPEKPPPPQPPTVVEQPPPCPPPPQPPIVVEQPPPCPPKPRPPPPPRPDPRPPPPPPRPEPEPRPPPPQPQPQPQPQPMPVCYPPPPGIYPVDFCCESCYRGQPGGPCYEFGRPQPIMCDPYSYGGWYSRPGYFVSPCGNYFSEENPQGCVVM